MKRFYVQGGEILSGPFEITKQSKKGPFYLRPNELNLYDKTPERLLELGWLPQEVAGYEPFNPVTQKRSGPVNTVIGDKVVSVYSIIEKTQQEIELEKTTAAQNEFKRPIIQTIIDALWKMHKESHPLATKDDYVNDLISGYKNK